MSVTTRKIDVLAYAGKSGKRYEFRLYVWETEFKALPAVYVVTERAVEPGAAPSYRPLFVGSTADISRVFENHPHQDCFQMYYANTIGVLREADEAARAAIEQDLIAALQPPCNTDQAL